MQCSNEEFVERWAQHIVERHKHSARSFGLFATRAINQTTNAILAIFGQNRRSRPKPLSWALVDKAYLQERPASRQDRQQDDVGATLIPEASSLVGA